MWKHPGNPQKMVKSRRFYEVLRQKYEVLNDKNGVKAMDEVLKRYKNGEKQQKLDVF